MRAGELRHKVTIRKATDSQGEDFGEATLVWSTYASVWAAVEPLSGRELVNADHVESGVTHRVRIRYLPGVVPKMQVVHRGRTLNIVSVLNKDERNIELHLMCMEEVGG